MKKLSHINDAGHVHMVDVTAKNETAREARARGTVKMKSGTFALLEEGKMDKGNVLTTAKSRASWQPKKPASSFLYVIRSG